MPPIAAPAPQFTLKLFGPFRLSTSDAEIPLRGRKAAALLAYLALVPAHRAMRDHAADLLWTDRGSDQARASLRQTLAELRAIAGMAHALQIGRSELALREGAIDTDLSRLMAAAERTDLAALADALTALDGDLLETLDDLAPRFDDWVVSERAARTNELVTQSLACAERQGMTQPREAQAILRALDRIDPLNEGVARLGMRLDHRAGDSAALHRRYRHLVDRLQTEFQVPPSEPTRTLFQQLTRGRAPAEAQAHLRPTPPGFRAVTDELVPTVIVAPLQVIGNPGITSEQAEFSSDAMRVAISALDGVKVLAADAANLADIVASSADSLALFLLSGKVRDPGNGAVATLQLANARDHTILWSESIELVDAADPVDLLVAKAVGALQPTIDIDLERAMRSAQPDLLDERAHFTHARLVIRNAADLEETRAGVAALERIVERNPRHLGARLLLGRMYNTDFWQQMTGHDVRELRRRAAEHLEAAASMAPNRVDVRVRRAWVLLRQGEYDGAARDFDAVLGTRHLDPDILNQCGFGLCHLGQLERAAALIQQAFDLNPFAPSDYHADYAVVQALLLRPEVAEEHFLVSGEIGLQYDAVRIANFAALPVLPRAAEDVQARFVRKFNAAWQRADQPNRDDVMAWVHETLPLREAAHRAFVTEGLERVLPVAWPAA